ncbi:MAG: hypothetical protein IJ427_13845 [Lachnospiraceae bacterium]|nr:hypothetical protein [Lachnospiraceae bacterium]
MVERSHEIEQIYMQQLKNIESAVYVLRVKKSSYENSLKNLRKPIADPVDPKKPKTNIEKLLKIFWIPFLAGLGFIVAIPILLWFVSLFFGLCGIFFDFFEKIEDWIDDRFWGIDVTVTIVLFLIVLIVVVYDYVDDKNWRKNYYTETVGNNMRIRRENEQQRKQNASLAKQREGQLAKINEELQRAIVVKDNLYSVNWIPGNYRNIRVAYYISDMVMSSAITMEEALKYYLLQEVNNKLDEVLRKLDEIIANQNQIIVNQAILESQNNELISQNENVIRRIAKTEESAQMAAEYAQVAVNYAEANAYFSWATYLKR